MILREVPVNAFHDLVSSIDHSLNRVHIEVCYFLVPELIVDFVLTFSKLGIVLWLQQCTFESTGYVLII